MGPWVLTTKMLPSETCVGKGVDAFQIDVAAIGCEISTNHVDGCCLSSSIRTQKGHDLSAPQAKRDIIDGDILSELLGNVEQTKQVNLG